MQMDFKQYDTYLFLNCQIGVLQVLFCHVMMSVFVPIKFNF